MTKIQKVILIVWCLAVTACLIYVPLKQGGSSGRTYAKTDYVWDSKDSIRNGWKIVAAPVILKVAALTVVGGTLYLLTIKRRET